MGTELPLHKERSRVRVVRSADVRDDAVEDDVRVLRDRPDVARQSDEERHASAPRRRRACSTVVTIFYVLYF